MRVGGEGWGCGEGEVLTVRVSVGLDLPHTQSDIAEALGNVGEVQQCAQL